MEVTRPRTRTRTRSFGARIVMPPSPSSVRASVGPRLLPPLPPFALLSGGERWATHAAARHPAAASTIQRASSGRSARNTIIRATIARSAAEAPQATRSAPRASGGPTAQASIAPRTAAMASCGRSGARDRASAAGRIGSMATRFLPPRHRQSSATHACRFRRPDGRRLETTALFGRTSNFRVFFFSTAPPVNWGLSIGACQLRPVNWGLSIRPTHPHPLTRDHAMPRAVARRSSTRLRSRSTAQRHGSPRQSRQRHPQRPVRPQS
jgi:hypothetical protein